MNAAFCLRFYLGLGAPATRSRRGEWVVRAAPGHSCDMIADLVHRYQRQEEHIVTVKRINHRCAMVTSQTGERYFVKEFPRQHGFHDLERAIRLSRVDRAWRAAHLLPLLGILTPRAVGTAGMSGAGGTVTEYLAAEWLDAAVPYPGVVRAAGEHRERRLLLLREFAAHLRHWHRQGVYVRDLVKNVLVRELTASGTDAQAAAGERTYLLSDLDGFHPLRRVTRARVLHQMRQLAHHVGPFGEEEVRAVCDCYLPGGGGAWGERIAEALSGPAVDAPPAAC
jgi:hypothetical protein